MSTDDKPAHSTPAYTDDPIIYRPELCKLVGNKSSETIRLWMKSGKLPQPDQRLSLKTMGWRRSTLQKAGII